MPKELQDIHTGGNTIDGVHCKHWREVVDSHGNTSSVAISEEEMEDYESRFGARDWYEWAGSNWGTMGGYDCREPEYEEGDGENITVNFILILHGPHRSVQCAR